MDNMPKDVINIVAISKSILVIKLYFFWITVYKEVSVILYSLPLIMVEDKVWPIEENPSGDDEEETLLIQKGEVQ